MENVLGEGKAMTETSLTKHISSNNIRAQQANTEGDGRRELRHLLFAVEDTCKLLRIWHMTQHNESLAMTHAKSLHHTTARIKELIDEGGIKQ